METQDSLTYIEGNAVSYIVGYVIRNLYKKLTRSNGTETLDSLPTLCNTNEDMEPAKSEEWVSSVDRGGLVRITEAY